MIFEIEDLPEDVCALSIYVAFNFRRGATWLRRSFWRLFRRLFPAFVHDVIWNHSLCQLKDLAEKEYEQNRAGRVSPARGMEDACAACEIRAAADSGR